jgi:predicted ribonuclease YlaK
MVFITLPIYQGHNNAYYVAPVARYDHRGQAIPAAAADLLAAPPVQYITINVAHISAMNDWNSGGQWMYLYTGGQMWNINMTLNAVMEEIKNAIKMSLEPDVEFVAMQPAQAGAGQEALAAVAG